MAIPNDWLISLEDSEMIPFVVPTIPERERGKEGGREGERERERERENSKVSISFCMCLVF